MFSPFQGKYAVAEPLYERAQAIQEKLLGPEHPDVADLLNSRATLLAMQVCIHICRQVEVSRCSAACNDQVLATRTGMENLLLILVI